MAVKHAFVNPHADLPDATDTRPSDWNANHVIDAATITLAMNVNVSASQRVIGRNTAGAGVQEEVTAAQIFDWVNSTNGVLLTRTAGTWGAVANVTTDNGDLQIATNASPVAPAAGIAKLHAQDRAGRPMLAQLVATNVATALQPFLGKNRVARWMIASATTFGAEGIQQASVGGTGTLRVPASTNLCTSLRRVGIVSGPGAGSISSLFPQSTSLQHWRGSAAGLGGFHAVFRFAGSDAAIVATANMFVGMRATAHTDVAPSTIANQIGVGCDSGDTVLQLYAAGAAAQARVSLGASFPVNNPNVDVYELELFCSPNGSTIKYVVTRLNTGDVASGTISAGANLPANTTFLGPQFARSNGGTATAVGIDYVNFYSESDF